MNMQNHPPEDQKWHTLLAHSASTFTGDTAPPYGFLTSTVARLNAEKRERDMLERIGLRSLFAALTVLVAVVGFSVGIQLQDRLDLDPTVKSLIQADEIPIS